MRLTPFDKIDYEDSKRFLSIWSPSKHTTEFFLEILKCSILTNTYKTDDREKLSIFIVLKNGIRIPGPVHYLSQQSEITKCNHYWIYLSVQILFRYK